MMHQHNNQGDTPGWKYPNTANEKTGGNQFTCMAKNQTYMLYLDCCWYEISNKPLKTPHSMISMIEEIHRGTVQCKKLCPMLK